MFDKVLVLTDGGGNDARHVKVEYDADEFVMGDMVDLLSQCGVGVAAVRRVRI